MTNSQRLLWLANWITLNDRVSLTRRNGSIRQIIRGSRYRISYARQPGFDGEVRRRTGRTGSVLRGMRS